MTWAEDATMSEGKQCLQRDVTEADVTRRGAGRTCLMLVVFLRRMMSTLCKGQDQKRKSAFSLHIVAW